MTTKPYRSPFPPSFYSDQCQQIFERRMAAEPDEVKRFEMKISNWRYWFNVRNQNTARLRCHSINTRFAAPKRIPQLQGW